MKKHMTLACLMAMAMTAQAQQQGGISAELLNQLKQSYQNTPTEKALRNAIGSNDIKKLVVNQENQQAFDTHFSIEVPSKGITNQRSSGRCWMFTGLNVMRAKAITKYDLPSLEFSQVYTFFYDQLEKSNLFLQAIMDTAGQPMEDQTVQWLFKNPIGDGGTFTGVADLVMKYGLVPKEVMPETYSSEHTGAMSSLLKQKLREGGLRLREKAAKGAKPAELTAYKNELLGTIYRMLTLTLGVPPMEFDYVRKDAQGNPVETEHHTPKSFLEKYGDTSLLTDYVMVMNDPTRDYYKCYEIAYDRHVYDGKNWKYVNLPVEDIKQMAIASLKDGNRMYFSSDLGQMDSQRGLLDMNNYDYASLMGTTFGMNKKERIMTFTSGSAHAMTLMAVDLDAAGQPKKWMVENSWGAESGYKGHLIMTDEWFNEYMFRLVLNTKYVPEKVLKVFRQQPVQLPAWDPMFAEEE